MEESTGVSVSLTNRRGFDFRFPISGSCSQAHVAQSVEHVLGKDEVTSSNLVVGSKKGNEAGAVRREA
jgi:hypothetical protein